MKDYKNSKEEWEKKYSEFLEKIEEKTKKYQEKIFQYKTKENDVMNKLDELISNDKTEEEEVKEINKDEKNVVLEKKIESKNKIEKDSNIKGDTEVFIRKSNKHSSVLDRNLIKRDKNFVIQNFIEEYKDNNNNSKIKRKNSFKKKK